MILFWIFYIVVLIYSIILHEIAHGLMAYSLGDSTAKNLGRLTLNPIPHIDPIGSIALPLISFLSFGFMFGYAKPVPYNPLNLRDQRYGPAKVALAGPLSNLLLAFLFGMVIRFVPVLPEALVVLLRFVVQINIVLAVFNLVPIPPLDGHWILFTFLPSRFAGLKYVLARYGWLLTLFFVFFLFQYLSPLINFIYNAIVGG